MTRPQRLEASEIQAKLCELAGWTLEDGKLFREFRFADFGEAFAFMTRSALAAEALDHHPDWCNVYDRVRVHLTTHDAGGLTSLDFELAAAMNRFADAAGR